MKIINVGSFIQGMTNCYHSKSENRVTGLSKTIEVGDVIAFDRKLVHDPRMVVSLERRDHRGVFKNPEDAKDAFFDAVTRDIESPEVKELLANEELMDQSTWS